MTFQTCDRSNFTNCKQLGRKAFSIQHNDLPFSQQILSYLYIIILYKIIFIRWLSHDAAAEAIRRCLNSVITSLEREAEERGDPMALGLSKMVKTYNFVATVHMMCDILPHLSRLSKVFQRQDVNLAHVEPMVRSTIAALEKMIAEPGIQLKKVNDVIRIDLSTHQISARVNERESFGKEHSPEILAQHHQSHPAKVPRQQDHIST